MTNDREQQQSEPNAYPMDVESASELVRLLDQDKVMTNGMGGIFPELTKMELEGITDVLDIACGPGGWILDVAYAYPRMQVRGIDISNSMIEYAQALAKVRTLKNAQFQVMNALQPLNFPDNSFDLVNMRSLFAVVAPTQWPELVQECKRILRPGGLIRWTEGEWGFSNAPAAETFNAWGCLALNKVGRSFSPTGQRYGITTVMNPLLKRANFQHVQHQAHAIDHSYGTQAHEGLRLDYEFGLPLLKPYITSTLNITDEDYERIREQLMQEMRNEDFYALVYLLTVWGEK